MQPRPLLAVALTVCLALVLLTPVVAQDALCGDHGSCESCAKSSGCTWCRTDKYCFTKSTTGVVCEEKIDDDEDCPDIKEKAKIIAGVIVGVVAGLICLCVCCWFTRRRQRNAQASQQQQDGQKTQQQTQIVMVPAYGVGTSYDTQPQPTMMAHPVPHLTQQQQYEQYEQYAQAARGPTHPSPQPHQVTFHHQSPSLHETNHQAQQHSRSVSHHAPQYPRLDEREGVEIEGEQAV